MNNMAVPLHNLLFLLTVYFQFVISYVFINPSGLSLWSSNKSIISVFVLNLELSWNNALR